MKKLKSLLYEVDEAKITAKRDKISDRPGEKKPYKTSGGYWAGKHKGEIEYFDSEEQAKDYIQHGHAADNEPGGTGGEEPDKPEPKQTSISATGGFDADDKPKPEKPKDYTGSIEGDEEAGELANDLAQGFDPDSAHQQLTDMGHGDLADDLKFADSDEEKARIIAKATGNEFYEESIKVINGKKYKAIKEEKKPKKHKLQETYERIANRMVT